MPEGACSRHAHEGRTDPAAMRPVVAMVVGMAGPRTALSLVSQATPQGRFRASQGGPSRRVAVDGAALARRRRDHRLAYRRRNPRSRWGEYLGDGLCLLVIVVVLTVVLAAFDGRAW